MGTVSLEQRRVDAMRALRYWIKPWWIRRLVRESVSRVVRSMLETMPKTILQYYV